MNLGFTGQIALVTGGTRGIGLAIAKALASEGAEVICTGTKAASFPDFDARLGTKIRCMKVDFTDSLSFEQFRKDLARETKVDILINNAGINRIKTLENTTDEDFRDLNDVNLRAPYILCRDLLPGMKRRGYGRIVNIASIWSVVTRAGRSIYSMNKHALVGLTKTLAVEAAPFGVLVNAVSPGFTETELTASTMSAEERTRQASQIPIGRFANPDEIAGVVAFLASSTNTYLTGQNVIVDGGFVHV